MPDLTPDDPRHRAANRFFIVWFTSMFVLSLAAMTIVLVVGLVTNGGGTPGDVAAAGPAPGTRTPTCSASAGLAGTDPVSDKGGEFVGGTDVTISAGDSFFDPTCAGGIAGGSANLVVSNSGQILHNISIPELGIDEDIPPGDSVSVTASLGDAPVVYYCKYHRTSGMVGSLAGS